MKHIDFKGRGIYSRACTYRWNQKRDSYPITFAQLAEYRTLMDRMDFREFVNMLEIRKIDELYAAGNLGYKA